MVRSVLVVLVSTLVSLAPAACDKGGATEAPAADPGASYFVYSGEVPFYDSGCAQERRPDGKLKKGMKFALVSAEDKCWLVTLEDEVDTYIVPSGHVRASGSK